MVTYQKASANRPALFFMPMSKEPPVQKKAPTYWPVLFGFWAGVCLRRWSLLLHQALHYRAFLGVDGIDARGQE